MQRLRSAIGRVGRAALCGGLVSALSLTAAAARAAEDADEAAAGTGVVGRVVSVRGAAYAQAPGEERRILGCDDPIYAGDRVRTQESSALGIVSGDYYTRLNESTQLAFVSAENGAPRLDLETGHVRLLDASGRSPARGGIATPGLVTGRAGRDTEAMVFAGEKAGVVSMVCAFEESVYVARRDDPSQTAAAAVGSCVVSKPREALYQAEATHPRLAVLMQDACESEPPLLVAASFFSPAQVALGPGILGGPSAAPDAVGRLMGNPLESCIGVTCGSPPAEVYFGELPPPPFSELPPPSLPSPSGPSVPPLD